MISKRSLAIAAAGVVVAGGIAAGVSGLAVGTAHAQGTISISIIGMGENTQGTAATVEVSVTCTATGTATTGTPSYVAVDATAIQGGTATGSLGNTICTGSPQNITITLGEPSEGIQLGTGPVQVGVSASYEYRGSYPYTYTYAGTTAAVSYTNP